ncbi:hypothetical protein JCM14469_24950 [Desulfatiferula olefinivorans]
MDISVSETRVSKVDAATPERIKRRRYLVDKPLQLTVAANMLLIIGLCTLVTAMGTASFFLYVLTDQLVWSLDRIYLVRVGIILVFMAAGVVVWTVLRVHSITGPIYKTRMILRDAAMGRFPARPVRFRKGDAFIGLARDLNLCLEVMQADREALDRQGKNEGGPPPVRTNACSGGRKEKRA